MRIGDFSKKYDVSKDTIRHYISLGLLIPDEQSAQYRFNERECKDMELILHMKKMKFSLKEIHNYLDIIRVSNMTEPESIRDIVAILNQKKEVIQEEISELQSVCDTIDEDILKHQYEVNPQSKTGIPLAALSYLQCPKCKQEFFLEGASLNPKYIFEGRLRCSCGYEAVIDNGIVKTANRYTEKYDKPDLARGLYRNVSEHFVTYMQKCTDFIRFSLKNMDLKKNVILEAHINGYFFLYNNLKYLETDCLYIIVDKYPEILEMYKSYIEKLNLNLNILYIADASMEWPICNNCVDVLISYMGDNEHSLYFKHPYIQDVRSYLKPNFLVLGAILGLRNHSESLTRYQKKYPEGDITGFMWEQTENIYKNANCTFHRSQVGTIYNSADSYGFSCHKDKEPLMIGYFAAEDQTLG